jgi:hypothetical protein
MVPKTPEIAGKDFSASRNSAAGTVAARGFTRRRRKLQNTGDLECLLPLSSYAGGEQHLYLQNTKKRKQQGFWFCLIVSDLLSSVFSFWFCSSLLQVAVGSEVRASASSLLRLADRAVLPCPSCSRMLASERRVSGRRCCDGKETSLLDLFQVAGGSVSSGMEIGGEAVVAGCCGEELLLLWCSLEAGVDGLPSLLLVVGLAAGAGGCSAAEEGKTCWLKREPWV